MAFLKQSLALFSYKHLATLVGISTKPQHDRQTFSMCPRAGSNGRPSVFRDCRMSRLRVRHVHLHVDPGHRVRSRVLDELHDHAVHHPLHGRHAAGLSHLWMDWGQVTFYNIYPCLHCQHVPMSVIRIIEMIQNWIFKNTNPLKYILDT